MTFIRLIIIGIVFIIGSILLGYKIRLSPNQINITGINIYQTIQLFLTAIIPFLTVWLYERKDTKIEMNKSKAKLKEVQFTQLYNRLFLIYLEYNQYLQVEWKEFDVEDAVIDNDQFKWQLEGKDSKKWYEAIDKINTIVQSNIHLLEYPDMNRWFHAKQLPTDFSDMNDFYLLHNAYKNFIKNSVDTFEILYHDYHFISKKNIDEIRKLLNDELKIIEWNPFSSDLEKAEKIEKINEEFKNLRSFRRLFY